MKLMSRFGMVGGLVICLYFLGGGTMVVGVSDDYQYPHPNCPPGVTCVPPNYPCGCGMSDIIEGTCSDIADLNTCAFSCQRYEGNACFRRPGNCQNAEMPLCDGLGMAVCNGSTWVCDNSGSPYNEVNSCSNQPVPGWCTNGAYCYNGNWYCANNQGCSGSPPECLDPTDVSGMDRIPAVCHNGIWLCGAP